MRNSLLVLGLALLLGGGAFAAETTATSITTSTVAKTDPAVLAKLNQILANQEDILKRFDAIDEELRIIKVRASLRN